MKRISGLLLVLLFAVAATRAYACSLLMPDPNEYFQQSEIVVMARPLELLPTRADLELRDLREPYDQVVKWQVLYSWKGNLASDSRITTSRRLHPDDPCVGWSVISDNEPRLIYATGVDPYTSYYSVSVSGARYFLQSLQHQSIKTQDP